MLPPTIPLFPLPNVVLFPGVFLPLHIFEERYRALTRDALAGDRIIGMALLRPGFEGDYDGRPSIYPIGCAGVISHSDRLPDGRFNIVLHGLSKFRIVEELTDGEYRRARIEPLTEITDVPARRQIKELRTRIETLLLSALKATEVQIPGSLSDEDLVHALCQYLHFEPAERQALLECQGTAERARALTEFLEMQALLAQHPTGRRPGVH
ncbi:MAG: LON peptidase substrate-binding domain-containing protein [Vicinamibacteraceae bacterium]